MNDPIIAARLFQHPQPVSSQVAPAASLIENAQQAAIQMEAAQIAAMLQQSQDAMTLVDRTERNRIATLHSFLPQVSKRSQVVPAGAERLSSLWDSVGNVLDEDVSAGGGGFMAEISDEEKKRAADDIMKRIRKDGPPPLIGGPRKVGGSTVALAGKAYNWYDPTVPAGAHVLVINSFDTGKSESCSYGYVNYVTRSFTFVCYNAEGMSTKGGHITGPIPGGSGNFEVPRQLDLKWSTEPPKYQNQECYDVPGHPGIKECTKEDFPTVGDQVLASAAEQARKSVEPCESVCVWVDWTLEAWFVKICEDSVEIKNVTTFFASVMRCYDKSGKRTHDDKDVHLGNFGSGDDDKGKKEKFKEDVGKYGGAWKNVK